MKLHVFEAGENVMRRWKTILESTLEKRILAISVKLGSELCFEPGSGFGLVVQNKVQNIVFGVDSTFDVSLLITLAACGQRRG